MPHKRRVSISNDTGCGADTEIEKSRFQVAKVRGDIDEDEDGDDDILTEDGLNQYQYTWNLKSLGQLTREALPKYDNYRDLMSVHAAPRPTLDELHNATFHEQVSEYQYLS